MTTKQSHPMIRIDVSLEPGKKSDVSVFTDSPEEREDALERLKGALPYLEMLENSLQRGKAVAEGESASTTAT